MNNLSLSDPAFLGVIQDRPSVALVTGQTLSFLRQNFNGYIGFKFTVGALPITVTKLGRWVVAGNDETHDIVITDSTGSSVLATATVDTLGASSGAYLFSTLPSFVTLSALTQYALLSQERDAGGSDEWYDSMPITTTAVVGSVISAYANNIPGGISTQNVSEAFGSPSLMYIL